MFLISMRAQYPLPNPPHTKPHSNLINPPLTTTPTLAYTKTSKWDNNKSSSHPHVSTPVFPTLQPCSLSKDVIPAAAHPRDLLKGHTTTWHSKISPTSSRGFACCSGLPCGPVTLSPLSLPPSDGNVHRQSEQAVGWWQDAVGGMRWRSRSQLL